MRLSLGGQAIIQTTERWYDEIRRGRAFAAFAAQAAIAAQNSFIQLFNPVASGVTCLINAVVTSAGAAGTLTVGFHNTALTTLRSAGRNLLNGGAAGNGQAREQSNAGALGTAWANVDVLALTSFTLPTIWIAELDAGEGFLIQHDIVNVALRGTFFWIELPV